LKKEERKCPECGGKLFEYHESNWGEKGKYRGSRWGSQCEKCGWRAI